MLPGSPCASATLAVGDWQHELNDLILGTIQAALHAASNRHDGSGKDHQFRQHITTTRPSASMPQPSVVDASEMYQHRKRPETPGTRVHGITTAESRAEDISTAGPQQHQQSPAMKRVDSHDERLGLSTCEASSHVVCPALDTPCPNAGSAAKVEPEIPAVGVHEQARMPAALAGAAVSNSNMHHAPTRADQHQTAVTVLLFPTSGQQGVDPALQNCSSTCSNLAESAAELAGGLSIPLREQHQELPSSNTGTF